jgi:hypothetical protein
MYNVADRSSFKSIPEWIGLAREKAEPCRPPVLIVAWDKGNKQRKVSTEEGQQLAENMNAFFTELYADPSVIEMEIEKFLEAVSI